jgi:hypothetical protein
MDREVERGIELWLEARQQLRDAVEVLEKIIEVHPSIPALIILLQSVRAMMSELAEMLTVLSSR